MILLPRFTLRPLAVAVLALGSPLLAMAETATVLGEVRVSGQADNDALTLKRKTTTGSRLGLTIQETPAAVTVVGRETLEQRGVGNTQEALRGVPGVSWSSDPGASGTVFFRGFSGASVTQMFNGITVQYDTIAARPVDSWIYDRVETIGGASSFLNGAGGVGGSVNNITKLANRDGETSEAKVGVGCYDKKQLAAGTNRQLSDNHYLRLDVNREEGGAWVDGMRREATQVAGSWLVDLSPALSHTLAVEYQKETVDRPYWGTPTLQGRGGVMQIDNETRFKNYNSRDGIYEQTVQWARSVLDYRVSDTLKLKNTVYAYDALRDYRNVEVYAFNAGNTAVTRSAAFLQRHDQKLLGNRFEFTWDSTLGGKASTWAGGVDYSLNKQTRFPLSVAGPFGSVNPYNFSTEAFFSVPGMVPGFNPDRNNRLKTLALFLENRTLLTPALSLVSGLRWEQIDLEVSNLRAASASNPAYFERRYQPLTGRLALNYELTPQWSTYVQYSTAADPPAGILTTANFSQLRNFDLTTGRQWEVGSKYLFAADKGQATVAYYDIVRRNIAVADPANPGTTLPIGQQSSHGVELAASYKLTPQWKLDGNLGLVAAQYDDFTENVGGVAVSRAGKRPANVPERVANAWLTFTPNARWELGADARYVSARFGDTANTYRDRAYTLFGAYASYKLDRRTTLTLRGKNLGDEVYAERVNSASMAYLGAPRSVELSLHTRF